MFNRVVTCAVTKKLKGDLITSFVLKDLSKTSGINSQNEQFKHLLSALNNEEKSLPVIEPEPIIQAFKRKPK